MTIAYRGGGSNSAAADTIIVTMSTTAVSGDLLIAIVAWDAATGTVTWPTGTWTTGGNASSSVDGGSISWAYRLAGASEPSTYTISENSSGGDISASVSAYSGVDNTTPLDVTATSASTGSSAGPWSIAATGVATGSANRWLLWVGGVDNLVLGTVSSVAPSASPATWTERVDNSNGFWVNHALYECLDSAGTFTSNVTAVQTNTGGGNGGTMSFLLALRAATAGGGANWLKQWYWWNFTYGNMAR